MPKFRPTSTCCGCLSLVVGIEIICLVELLNSILMVAVTSSKEELQVSGVKVSPMSQVIGAAWSLVGIPIILSAGVGALYRIEFHMRLFLVYLGVSLLMLVYWCLYVLMNGQMCSTMVEESAQRLGSAFVCGFTDMVSLFWVFMLFLLKAYGMYIVWSASEEIASNSYPELLRYTATLRSMKLPEEPEDKSLAGASAASAYPWGAPGPLTPVLVPQMLPPIQTMADYGASSWQAPQTFQSVNAVPQQNPQTPLAVAKSAATPPPADFYSRRYYPITATTMSVGEPQSFAPAPPSGYS